MTPFRVKLWVFRLNQSNKLSQRVLILIQLPFVDSLKLVYICCLLAHVKSEINVKSINSPSLPGIIELLGGRLLCAFSVPKKAEPLSLFK